MLARSNLRQTEHHIAEAEKDSSSGDLNRLKEYREELKERIREGEAIQALAENYSPNLPVPDKIRAMAEKRLEEACGDGPRGGCRNKVHLLRLAFDFTIFWEMHRETVETRDEIKSSRGARGRQKQIKNKLHRNLQDFLRFCSPSAPEPGRVWGWDPPKGSNKANARDSVRAMIEEALKPQADWSGLRLRLKTAKYEIERGQAESLMRSLRSDMAKRRRGS